MFQDLTAVMNETEQQGTVSLLPRTLMSTTAMEPVGLHLVLSVSGEKCVVYLHRHRRRFLMNRPSHHFALVYIVFQFIDIL
jgi:hypothetical protein